MVEESNPLARYRAPAGAGAAFAAHRDRAFARIEPLTLKAEAWLRANTEADAAWDSGMLVVELRYFPPLADAIIEAGFLFERETFPN